MNTQTVPEQSRAHQPGRSPRHRGINDRARAKMRVAPDVYRVPVVMVNAYLIGDRESGEWVLVDAGLPMSAHRIARAAKQCFGTASRPSAIILTHGHFDHVGALPDLADRWGVPIYAHELEMPYLTGRSDYPPPDPTVGGGLMAATSFIYPRHAYDFGDRVRPLPPDGTVPHLPAWRWIHTPGHAPGHVSLFRDADRVLVAGDAFVTQKQESLLGVLTGHQHVFGPPKYFTPDWPAAGASVRRLAALNPTVAATGHGIPMCGERLFAQLQELAQHFDAEAVPAHGRYVPEPALADWRGVRYVPPARLSDAMPLIVGAAAIAGVAAAVMATRRRGRG